MIGRIYDNNKYLLKNIENNITKLIISMKIQHIYANNFLEICINNHMKCYICIDLRKSWVTMTKMSLRGLSYRASFYSFFFVQKNNIRWLKAKHN